MDWLSNFLKAVGAVLMLLVLVAYMLPDRHLVERQRVIARPAEQIWPLLAQPRQWQRWSPWHGRDPEMAQTFQGPESGAGSEWSWASTSLGRGRLRFDSAQMPVRLTYSVLFPDGGSTVTGEFRLEPAAGGTRVIWTWEALSGSNPLLRWYSWLQERCVGQDFDAGLERLAAAIV